MSQHLIKTPISVLKILFYNIKSNVLIQIKSGNFSQRFKNILCFLMVFFNKENFMDRFINMADFTDRKNNSNQFKIDLKYNNTE